MPDPRAIWVESIYLDRQTQLARWRCIEVVSASCVLQFPGSQYKPPTFKPLGQDEEPGPGTLLGIDTEFVAHSPPDRVLKGCVSCSMAAWSPLPTELVKICR